MLKKMGFFLVGFVLLFSSSLLFVHSAEAKSFSPAPAPCGHEYQIGPTSSYTLNQGEVDVSLFVDTCTHSNYAVVYLTSVPGETLDGQAFVQRGNGPDGGPAQSWGNECSRADGLATYCYSPELYAPHNPAQACWNDYDYDYTFCTSWML